MSTRNPEEIWLPILVKHSYFSVLIFVSFWIEWVERLAVNAKVVTFLVSIPASSDTVESEGGRKRTYKYRMPTLSTVQVAPKAKASPLRKAKLSLSGSV